MTARFRRPLGHAGRNEAQYEFLLNRPDLTVECLPDRRSRHTLHWRAAPQTKDRVRCAACRKRLAAEEYRGRFGVYCLECQFIMTKPPENLPAGAVNAGQAACRATLFERQVFHTIDGIETSPEHAGFARTRFEYTPLEAMPDFPEEFFEIHPFGKALRKRAGQLPVNRGVAIDVTYRAPGLFGRSRKHYRFAALCYAPYRRMIEQGGFLTEPGTASDAFAALNHFEWDPWTDGPAIIFSPCGWAADVSPPKGVVLVALSEEGWSVRESLDDRHLAVYVRGLFPQEGAQRSVHQSVDAVFKRPGINFPLRAGAVAREEGLPYCAVIAAFQQLVARENGLVIRDDADGADWLLDIR